MLRKTIIFLLFWFCIVWPVVDTSYGDTTKAYEYTIKAAFIYKFAKFVEWPEESEDNSDEFILCIISENAPNSAFLKLNGKEVRGKKVSIKFAGNLGDIGYCHIAFIEKSKEKEVTRILSILNSQSTLTVAEVDGFDDRGGMINFIREKQNISFKINVRAVNKAGLKMSSKLIRVSESLADKGR